jgi:hypothetical protein
MFGVTSLDTVLAIIATILGMVGVCLNYAQLRRTPKPKPEPAPPMSVTIIGVPVHRVRDLPGHDR